MDDTQQTLEFLESAKTQAPPSSYEKNAIAHLRRFFLERGISKELYKAVGAYFDLTPNSPSFGYVVFPFADKHTVARKFIDGMVGERYLNSKGTKQFYGIENLDKSGDVVLVEGIYDLLALRQLGFKNIVASLSTSFNEAHAYDLRGRTVFILSDSDYAGFKGTEKAIETFSAIKANPIPLDLRELCDYGKDPHEVFVRNPERLKDWLTGHIAQYDSADAKYIREVFLANRDALKYFPTELPTYDRYLGGGYKEGFHVVCGEPGVGKSCLALWLTTQMGLKAAKVLYCTYEISKRQCWARVASQFDVHNWEQIEMDPRLINESTRAILTTLSDHFRIVAGWSVNEIERAAPNYDIIVVDYIQRMGGNSSDVRTNVSQNSQKLSNLARDDKKVIICVSSLNRSGYKAEAGMRALKESGDIEYVAQSITRLFGTGINNGTIIAELLKNSRGPLGKVWLSANLGASKFMETSPVEAGTSDKADGGGYL